jgi:hypothetical protein
VKVQDMVASPMDAWLVALAELAADRAAERACDKLTALFPGPSTGPAPLLDRAGLARALDVSIATIDRLVLKGCPFVMVLDCRRFDLDEVKPWLRSRPYPSERGEP